MSQSDSIAILEAKFELAKASLELALAKNALIVAPAPIAAPARVAIVEAVKAPERVAPKPKAYTVPEYVELKLSGTEPEWVKRIFAFNPKHKDHKGSRLGKQTFDRPEGWETYQADTLQYVSALANLRKGIAYLDEEGRYRTARKA